MKLGEYIKQRRMFLKLTQVELSTLLHITPQCLSNYENEKTKIPLSIVLDLCYYLKIDVNDFFTLAISEDESTISLQDYNFDNIYKNIAYYREQSKLTLKELSKKVGISLQRLSDFELNKTSPSIEEYISLCNFYNINYDDLFLAKKDNLESKYIYKKTNKISSKKYLYAGIAGISVLLITSSIAIPLGIIYSKPNGVSPITTPSISKFLIKESINKDNSVTTLIKNQNYYLFAYIDNSYNFPISSFKINDKEYTKEAFHEESTNKKVIMRFNSSVLDLGTNKITIEGFSYLDQDKKINNVSFNNQDLIVNVLSDTTPLVSLDNIKTSATSIKGDILINNDSNNILNSKNITISLKRDDVLFSSMNFINTFEFNNLNPDTSYLIEGKIKCDLYDGKGNIEHILFSKTIKTLPLITISNLESTYNSISYHVDINENNKIQNLTTSLIDIKSNKEIYNSIKLENSINDLLSNHKYLFKVIYKDLITNTSKKISKEILTKAISKPSVDLDIINLSEEYFEIKPSIVYSLINFTFNSIELKSLTDSTSVKYNTNKISYSFDSLLSNTSYSITYNYSYDLLDGNGVINDFKKITVKTKSYIPPKVEFDKVSADDTSIFIAIKETKDKISPTYLKTEIYKNDVLLETTSSRTYKFKNLESNYSHVLKLYYSYDLNDGNGVVTKIETTSIITSSDIFIEDLRPGN